MYPYIDAKIKLYLIKNQLNSKPLESSHTLLEKDEGKIS